MTKWFSLLVYPLQQVILLLLVALVSLWLGRRRLAGAALSVAFCWLYLCACPLVADQLMARLERGYPPRAAATLPEAPAMVVLGGSTRGDTSVAQGADLNAQADRLLFAAALYRLGKAPLLVLSGGSAVGARPEAMGMADALASMGVSRRAMLPEGHSRTTYENALYSAQLLRQRGIDSALLVTSAFHMPRAEAAFRAQGIRVIPAATDYQRLIHPDVLPPWIPSLDALERTTAALREMAGMVVYRARGYL